MDIYQNIDSKLCNGNIDTIFDLDARTSKKTCFMGWRAQSYPTWIKKGLLEYSLEGMDRNKSVHRGGVGVSIGFQFDYNS